MKETKKEKKERNRDRCWKEREDGVDGVPFASAEIDKTMH